MTPRERATLDVVLSVEFDGVEALRSQARSAVVERMCGCGCPSIDFAHPPTEPGMWIRVDATIQVSSDGLFLYTEWPWLGGIEYVGMSVDKDPDEFPDPGLVVSNGC